MTVNSVQPGLHATDRLLQLHGGDVSKGAPARGSRATPTTSAPRWPSCALNRGFITGTALQIDGGAFPGLLEKERRWHYGMS